MTLRMPVAWLSEAISNCSFDSNILDQEVLGHLGIFVVRELVSEKTCGAALSMYRNGINMEVVGGHPTKIIAGDEALELILADPGVGECCASFFGGRYLCTAPQIFRKNKDWPDPVKLHNDLMYMAGWQEKYSVFVALTDCNADNGGLILYPGTHNFGLLGDAGELDRAVLPEDLPAVCPSLRPGDCLIMHSATWHESGMFLGGGERVYFEFKLVHSDDPAYGCSESRHLSESYRLPEKVENLFIDSRLQRLQKFYDG
ncbi:phytanoyl-CoA dioxygenase family protein [Luminiphilus sp.]|nr:phytanoyl-CoA dioxygenase family protein [Luminiphilus sp.]